MKTLSFALALALSLARTGLAGSISGTVKGSDGSSVTAGLVSVLRQDASLFPGTRSPSSSSILPDGTFEFASLPYGEYQICVQARGTAWLNSCEWGYTGTQVSLSSSQPSATISIVLTKGALIMV